MFPKIFLLPIIYLILIACSPRQIEETAHQGSNMFDVNAVLAHMPPLSFNAIQEFDPAIHDYFNYYHLSFPGVRHYFGTFVSDPNQIAAHIFVPPEAEGSVVVIHGYYDHTGIMRNVINCCLEMQLAVAIFDLPGHGLSTGERFTIGDFQDYVKVLDGFIRKIKPELPRPFYLIGHSTGCAIAFEFMHACDENPFEKIIFMAPLVRHAHWQLSKVGYVLANPIVNSVPRKHRKNSSDPDFLKRVKQDPLQAYKRTPFGFINAVYNWNNRIQHYDPIDQEILIIQGDADVVVDWKYNLPFLQSKFARVQIDIIEGGNHQLGNERIDMRNQVFDCIRTYFGDQ